MNEQKENRTEENLPEESHPHVRRARRTLTPFAPTLEEKKEEVDENADNPEEAERIGEEISPAETEKEAQEAPTFPADTKDEKKDGAELTGAAGVFDWIKSFIVSLTAVIFIFTLIFRGVTVSGGSMLPTLENGEYLIISDLLYTPEGGDIVVVQSPTYKNGTEPLIKRIIATGGQTVRINFNTWQVWVDGVELNEDYILKDSFPLNYEDMTPDENGFAETTVKEDCVFVMGDNRNDSLDSRSDSVGQIHKRYIMGRVLLRITPLNRFGAVD